MKVKLKNFKLVSMYKVFNWIGYSFLVYYWDELKSKRNLINVSFKDYALENLV